ncbi:MAG: L,D-transpeptidase family protein [Chloroflexi bacterium]|nr:L,D-transpeptidase family protein [Chloroflexota bacterium]
MKRILSAFCLALLVFGPMLFSASTVEAVSWTGYVTTDAVNVRAAPSAGADIIDVLYFGEQVTVVDQVTGDFAAGTSTWYQLASGGYATSAYIGETQGSSGGGAIEGSGHWIDVNLSAQTATAYIDGEPVYTAYVTTGKPGDETPTGTFTIFSRVYNETMVSNEPGDSYFQDNVLFTQYFAGGGYALHYNYWQPDYVFGSTPTSHGCVGMRYGDAAFFWDFADYGTTVVIHY